LQKGCYGDKGSYIRDGYFYHSAIEMARSVAYSRASVRLTDVRVNN